MMFYRSAVESRPRTEMTLRFVNFVTHESANNGLYGYPIYFFYFGMRAVEAASSFFVEKAKLDMAGRSRHVGFMAL